MNSLRIIIALALTAAAIPGLAGDASGTAASARASTRADVLAELGRARLAGELGTIGDSDRTFNHATTRAPRSNPPRDRALEDLQRARGSGELEATGDVYGANLGLGRAARRVQAETAAKAGAASPAPERQSVVNGK